MEGPRIALYVSSVEGHHVQRYGTTSLIGATIDCDHPGNIRWDTAKIVAIPEAEYELYRREYDRLLEDGALKKRTAEEYEAHLDERHAAIDDAHEKAVAAAEAEAKAKAAAEAKTKEEGE